MSSPLQKYNLSGARALQEGWYERALTVPHVEITLILNTQSIFHLQSVLETFIKLHNTHGGGKPAGVGPSRGG